MSAPRTSSRGAQTYVVEQLRLRIAGGDLLPGAGLSENALSRELGVSRTPIREALKQLQAEGMVVIRPKVGSFVSAPSRREIIEMFEVKAILEGAAARLLAGRSVVPELGKLRENLAQSDMAVTSGDIGAYERLVTEFHDPIVSGSGNRKLVDQYRYLLNQLLVPRFIHISLQSRNRAEQSDREHSGILQMIEAADGTTAERLMRDHVRASREALMEGLALTEGRDDHFHNP